MGQVRLFQEKADLPQLRTEKDRSLRAQPSQERPRVRRPPGRRLVPGSRKAEEVAIELLVAERPPRARVRRDRQGPVAPRRRASPPRDRRDDGGVFQNLLRVTREADRRRDVREPRCLARSLVCNGCSSESAGLVVEARAPEGERETDPRSISRFACRRPEPYSAFIRAIIFLFAAFSFRLRRSLGFSKC